ncbi:MAG: helix-turn-helix domain-containing protein [Azospirillaceae bacterium]|nr:helix-turn-helix domain-containing protein [Azospirillaceae bacterium]
MGKRKKAAERPCIVAKPQIVDRTVKSAVRVLEILEYFDDIQRQSTVMEVADALGYPQSSTSALLRSLVMLGYLNYDPNARTYITSGRVALLGSWMSSQFVGDGKIVRLMKALNKRTGDTIVLAVRNGLNVQYIHVVQASAPERAHLTLGTVRSLVMSGAGYALLSTMSDSEAVRLAVRINAEAPEGEPHVDIRSLRDTLSQVRRQGYAFTCNLVTNGGGIIAAPLPRMADQPQMVIGIGGVSDVMRSRKEALAATLKEMIGLYAASERQPFMMAPRPLPAPVLQAAVPRGGTTSIFQM